MIIFQQLKLREIYFKWDTNELQVIMIKCYILFNLNVRRKRNFYPRIYVHKVVKQISSPHSWVKVMIKNVDNIWILRQTFFHALSRSQEIFFYFLYPLPWEFFIIVIFIYFQQRKHTQASIFEIKIITRLKIYPLNPSNWLFPLSCATRQRKQCVME